MTRNTTTVEERTETVAVEHTMEQADALLTASGIACSKIRKDDYDNEDLHSRVVEAKVPLRDALDTAAEESSETVTVEYTLEQADAILTASGLACSKIRKDDYDSEPLHSRIVEAKSTLRDALDY